jgi:hypothetical protein
MKDVEFAACVYKGLVDDFARQSVKAIAGKVIKMGRKRFSRMTIHAGERQISAWDYYCYGLLKGDTAYGDKFIHNFLRLALLEQFQRKWKPVSRPELRKNNEIDRFRVSMKY